MNLFTTTALMASVALTGAALADGHLPLQELPGIADRDHWIPGEVNAPGKLEALQAVVGSEAVPFSGTIDAPVQIALIYPSADTSDFWARNFLALTKRLDQLGIAYETTEFASRQIEHSLQSTYANQVAQDADLYYRENERFHAILYRQSGNRFLEQECNCTVAPKQDLLDLEPLPLDAEHGEEKVTTVAYIREDECIGCTKCIQACPVDAILGAAKQMHTVIASECTGCDLCIEPCPVDCIDLVPRKSGIGFWHWPLPAPPSSLTLLVP